MARAATSRNLWPFSKRKPARKKKAAVKSSRFGWLTEKKETYRRDVKGERAELVRQAKAGKSARAGEQKRLLEELKEDAWTAGQNDKQGGRKPTPYRITLLTSPRWEEAFGKRRARELVESSYKAGYRQNPQSCARTKKVNVTDRAKRYRANQPGCRPSGVKKCKLCGSRSDMMVDHADGNESNGRKSNLRWLCRSCNNTLGAEMARTGQGRRTVQYNPAHKGAQTLGEYMQAVLQHTRGAHDAAGKIIHETPKSRRRQFASEIWARRESHGTTRPGSGRTGQDEPDWVTNPTDPVTMALYLDAEQSGRLQAASDRRHGNRKRRPELDYIAIDTFHPDPRMDHDRHESGIIAFFLKGYNEGWKQEGSLGRRKGFTGTAAADRPFPKAAYGRFDEAVPAVNPMSTEYRLGYNLGQMDRQTAALRRTDDELTATFKAQFSTADWWKRCPIFISGYDDGYKLGEPARAGVSNPRNGRLHGGRGLSQRRNPETEDDGSTEYQQAKKTAELFHGRPVKEEIEVKESIRTHDWYVSLGPLVELKIKTLTKKKATLPFSKKEGDIVHLFCSPDGRQFYLRGGDQELNLEPLGMGPDSEWYRDHMLIGEAKVITYRDRKKFHKFSLTDYFHKLGEVTGQKPMLAYDTLAQKLSILGGQYKVEMDDLVEGMSPGIVN